MKLVSKSKLDWVDILLYDLLGVLPDKPLKALIEYRRRKYGKDKWRVMSFHISEASKK
jgi:hypothetical protein